MNVRDLSSNEIVALSNFFRTHFLGDQLEKPSDLNEALDDYIESEEDPKGAILFAGVSKLHNAPDYSEDDMITLAETAWRGNGAAKLMGYTYKAVLSQLFEVLSKRNVDGIQQTQPDVFIELVNKYASVIGEPVAQMLREDYGHGEGQIALESFLDNLTEQGVEVAPADQYDLSVLARAYGRSDYPSGKGVYWK